VPSPTPSTDKDSDRGAATRRRIVRAAGELFRRQGYDGTGLNQILDESETPRGSLYFHFPGGKEQLAVEAVADQGAWFGAGIRKSLASSDDAGEAISRIIDFIASDFERTGNERACPIGAVSLDAAAESEPVRVACRAVFDDWLEIIAAKLRDNGWMPAAARDEAALIVAAVEGALILGRTQRDGGPLRAVARRLRAELAA
jgi:TetR/AcrR family transcriptional repressor of lmrAB and yxaGH operons